MPASALTVSGQPTAQPARSGYLTPTWPTPTRRSGNVGVLQLLEAGAITAEALLTLAEVGLNALIIGNKIIEGMLCLFTLGFGCWQLSSRRLPLVLRKCTLPE